MHGAVALGAFIALWDTAALAHRRRRFDTISSSLWRTQSTPLGRAVFLLAWAALTIHVVKRPRSL